MGVVGDRVKLFAKARFKTQAAMASAVGMTASQISDIVNGRQVPATETLERFARVGMNINWLLSGEGAMVVGSSSRASPDVATVDPTSPPSPFDESPVRYSNEQLQNFRVLDDGGMADLPVHAGPAGIAAVRLARVRALQRRERELAERERTERQQIDAAIDEELRALDRAIAEGFASGGDAS